MALTEWGGRAAESVVTFDAQTLLLKVAAGSDLTSKLFNAKTGGATVAPLSPDGTPVQLVTDAGGGIPSFFTQDAVTALFIDRGPALPRLRVYPANTAASTPAATETVAGTSRFATATEAANGGLDNVAMSPLRVAAAVSAGTSAVADAAVATHVANPDPHPQYLLPDEAGTLYVLRQELGAPNGAAMLDANGVNLSPIQSSVNPTANTIVKRSATGTVKGADPALDPDLVTLRVLNSRLAAIVTGVQAPLLVPTDFTLPASTAGVATITGLSKTLAAGEAVLVSAFLVAEAETGADLTFRLNIPASATAVGKIVGLGTAAASTTATSRTQPITFPVPSALAASFGGLGIGTFVVVEINVHVVMGTSNGTVSIQAAHDAPHTTAGRVLAGSWALMPKVAA